jgi:hypothetical protein
MQSFQLKGTVSLILRIKRGNITNEFSISFKANFLIKTFMLTHYLKVEHVIIEHGSLQVNATSTIRD